MSGNHLLRTPNRAGEKWMKRIIVAQFIIPLHCLLNVLFSFSHPSLIPTPVLYVADVDRRQHDDVRDAGRLWSRALSQLAPRTELGQRHYLRTRGDSM